MPADRRSVRPRRCSRGCTTRPAAGTLFLKDTMDHQHDEVLADQRFLAGARHAFLIRRPEEIAASYYALFPPMTINAIGMERLCEMQAAIAAA